MTWPGLSWRSGGSCKLSNFTYDRNIIEQLYDYQLPNKIYNTRKISKKRSGEYYNGEERREIVAKDRKSPIPTS
jgi:hypothetical protein